MAGPVGDRRTTHRRHRDRRAVLAFDASVAAGNTLDWAHRNLSSAEIATGRTTVRAVLRAAFSIGDQGRKRGEAFLAYFERTYGVRNQQQQKTVGVLMEVLAILDLKGLFDRSREDLFAKGGSIIVREECTGEIRWFLIYKNELTRSPNSSGLCDGYSVGRVDVGRKIQFAWMNPEWWSHFVRECRPVGKRELVRRSTSPDPLERQRFLTLLLSIDRQRWEDLETGEAGTHTAEQIVSRFFLAEAR